MAALTTRYTPAFDDTRWGDNVDVGSRHEGGGWRSDAYAPTARYWWS